MKKTLPVSKNELTKLIGSEPALKTGEFGLAVAVFADCFFTLRDGKNAPAWRFIDDDNSFFGAFTRELGLEPGELRKLVLGALGEHQGRV